MIYMYVKIQSISCSSLIKMLVLDGKFQNLDSFLFLA